MDQMPKSVADLMDKLTYVHFAMIGAFALFMIFVIVWGIRLRAKRRAAEDELEDRGELQFAGEEEPAGRPISAPAFAPSPPPLSDSEVPASMPVEEAPVQDGLADEPIAAAAALDASPAAEAVTEPVAEPEAAPEPIAEPEPAAEVAPEPEPIAEAAPEPAPAAEPEPVAEPVAEVPAEPEPALEAPAAPEVAEAPAEVALGPIVETQAPEPAPVAETPAAEPVAEAVSVSVAEPQPAPEPVAAAGPDDLTRMKGVGPRLAERLNSVGVASFAQIAALTPEDAAALDAKLGDFQGRLARDRWIEQAGYLAKGDIAGFEEVFGKL